MLALCSVTLNPNILEYTVEYSVEQILKKIISLPPQILIQESTVLVSGLLSQATEINREWVTKYSWWQSCTETEILGIHSFSVLADSQGFHLFCKCKDKPTGYHAMYCTTDTLMGYVELSGFCL